jgi:hypothetical protein
MKSGNCFITGRSGRKAGARIETAVPLGSLISILTSAPPSATAGLQRPRLTGLVSAPPGDWVQGKQA